MKGLLSEDALEEPRGVPFDDWGDGLLAPWSPRPAAYLTPMIGRLGGSAMQVLFEPRFPPVGQVDGRRRLPQGPGGAIVGGGEAAATQAGDEAVSAAGRAPAALQQAGEAATGSARAAPAGARATVPTEAVRFTGWQPAEAAPQGAQQDSNEDIIPAAAGDRRCQGFSGGCESGGSWGSPGSYSVSRRTLCQGCAVRYLGIEALPQAEQTHILHNFTLQPLRTPRRR